MTAFRKLGVRISLAFFFIVLCSLTAISDAETLRSTNYKIDVDAMDAGGDYSYSFNYDLFDSIGQSSAIGPSSSAAHYIYGGFWYALSGISSPYRISGSGYNYPEPGYRASLSLNVTESSLSTGWLRYYYSRLRLNFISISITSIIVEGNMVTVTGEGTVNGIAGYKFMAIITDGNFDTMGITIFNPDDTIYFESSPSLISSGDFQIDIPILCVNEPISIIGSPPLYHSTLKNAYDTAINGETVRVRDIVLTESLNMDRNISLSIKGGFDCNYWSNTGVSTINGTITINNGTITMENIVLQ